VTAVARGVEPDVLRREHVRRRWLLLALTLLIVLPTSPVLGHHVVGAVDWLPSTVEHVGSLCMVSLHLLLVPMHSVFHWLLGVGLVVATWDRVRAVRRVRAVCNIEGEPVVPGSRLAQAAALAGLDVARVRVLEGSPIPAFTVGWLRPRVLVARDLQIRLTLEELAAVLLHEKVHVARRDPLRLSALRFLAMVAFWIPALRRVADDLADEAEIDADSEAARKFPIDLASALVTLAGGPTVRRQVGDLVEFGSGDLLERRVKRLAGVKVEATSRVSRRSLGAAAMVLLLAWSSGVMALHPLPDGTAHAAPPHCLEHTSGVLSHLLCQGGLFEWADRECPHRA
jgi:Zn-dependent protease with chaperone function